MEGVLRGARVSPVKGQTMNAPGTSSQAEGAEARGGDILVWKGIAPDTTPHSAVLTAPAVAPGKAYLADTAMLR